MGIKKWIAKAMFGDLRGMNPNSMANLAQNRPLMSTAPAPVAPPADIAPPKIKESAPVSDQDFFQRMMQYEQWRAQIYETEQRKRSEIYQQIQQVYEQETEDQAEYEEQDPVMGEIIKQVLPSLIARATQAEAPSDHNTQHSPPSQPVAAVASAVSPSPSTDAIQANAAAVVADLEVQHPKIIKAVRAGKYSKEQVISYLAMMNVPADNAEILYDEVMKSG